LNGSGLAAEHFGAERKAEKLEREAYLGIGEQAGHRLIR
jgi:hypothetical protein